MFERNPTAQELKDEAEFIVLSETMEEEAANHAALVTAFQKCTSRSPKEFLRDFVEAVQKGDHWSAIVDLKALTGEHIAECNEFYQSLHPGLPTLVFRHVEKDV